MTVVLSEDEANAAVSVALARLPDMNDVAVAFGLPPGSMQLNGLQLTNPETTFEEWTAYGHIVGAFGRWHRFALGDWLLFGEAIFGEDSAQATEGTAIDRYDVAHRVTGLQVATLQNYASLCGRIPLSIRRAELDFSTHEPVAALDREEQIYWLEQAVVNGYDRGDLREAIKAAKLGDPEPVEDGVVVEPPLSRTERLERAAQLVYQTWQPTSDGSFLVPAEPAAQLREALGEE